MMENKTQNLAITVILAARHVLRGGETIIQGTILLRRFNTISQGFEKYLNNNELAEIRLANDIIDVMRAFGYIMDKRLDPNYFILDTTKLKEQ